MYIWFYKVGPIVTNRTSYRVHWMKWISFPNIIFDQLVFSSSFNLFSDHCVPEKCFQNMQTLICFPCLLEVLNPSKNTFTSARKPSSYTADSVPSLREEDTHAHVIDSNQASVANEALSKTWRVYLHFLLIISHSMPKCDIASKERTWVQATEMRFQWATATRKRIVNQQPFCLNNCSAPTSPKPCLCFYWKNAASVLDTVFKD